MSAKKSVNKKCNKKEHFAKVCKSAIIVVSGVLTDKDDGKLNVTGDHHTTARCQEQDNCHEMSISVGSGSPYAIILNQLYAALYASSKKILGDVLIDGKKWNTSRLSATHQPAAEEESVDFHLGPENIGDTDSDDRQSIAVGIAPPSTLVPDSSGIRRSVRQRRLPKKIGRFCYWTQVTDWEVTV
ncbi:unnamed protein product [Caretta caretta]